ncbi:MAG TPA: porphobilinogen synthase, partial [Rhodobacteraceae bacterium]|nr:porphobilinogen synthase [Paracoccaceae bacterium]
MRPTQAPYPMTRHRRVRQSPAIRALVSENTLTTADLIWPVFVRDGEGVVEPVASMPGVNRLSVDKVVEAAREAADLGIPAICLFPYTDPAKKTATCEEAWNPGNLSNTATRAIKAAVPGIAVMTDVALDPYNSLGHDGFYVEGEILNDETVAALVKQALSQAEAGADIIGPSDMMDGRIGAIRQALETGGHTNVMLMSYAAKYASAFYGPFRDAVGASGALKGDKKSYQMDPANTDEALRLIERDLREGADMV